MELGRDCAPTNTTTTVSLPSRDAAKLWMIQHQRGRRNWTAEQISYWRGKQYELEKQLHGGDRKSRHQSDTLITTAKKLAAQHNVGQATIHRDAAFARAVDTAVEAVGKPACDALLNGSAGEACPPVFPRVT
jgi:hypothetical protein